MDHISIPVSFQLPAPRADIILQLNAGQSVTWKFADKRMRHLITSSFPDVDIKGVTFTCGSPLPDMSAAEYSTQHGTIFARGSDLFLQQLQHHVNTLRTQMTSAMQDIAELKLGRPQLLEDQRRYRKILRRDIVVRARDLLSAEGAQPATASFYQFSTQLSTAFLEERNLTESCVILINGSTIPDGDAIAHHSSPEELLRGLEGLSGDKRANMQRLYDFVMSRQH